MQCTACGSSNGQLKNGTSNKTGKPWRGWKCLDCDNMDFLRTPAGGQGGKGGSGKGGGDERLRQMLMLVENINTATAQIVSAIPAEKMADMLPLIFKKLLDEDTEALKKMCPKPKPVEPPPPPPEDDGGTNPDEVPW